MRPLVLNVALAAAAVLVLIVLYVFVVAPASRGTQDAVLDARIAAEDARREIPELAGGELLRDLQVLQAQAANVRDELGAELSAHEAQLETWFPRLGINDARTLPPTEDFASAYAFSQDRLKEEVQRRVREVSGRTIRDVALAPPVFLAQNRLPRREEMAPAQWAFNLERLLLTAAAAHGAWPSRALRLDRAWRAERGSDGFDKAKVQLALSIPASSLSRCLRALVELEGKGPIVRLIGLATRPMPRPAMLLPEDVLTVDADVTLEVATVPGRN